MDKISEIIRTIIEDTRKYRRVVMSLAVIVVFVTTYLMILPAITLESDKADKMAGIRLRETSADIVSGESGDPAKQDTVDAADTDGSASVTGADTEADHNSNNPEITGDSESVTDENIDPEPSEGYRSEATDTKTSGSAFDTEQDADVITDADVGPDNEDSTDQKQLEYKGEGYTISIEDPQYVLPDGTELSAAEITSDHDKYEKYCTDVMSALEKDEDIDAGEASEPNFVRLYDIKLLYEGKEIEPDDTVKVIFRYDLDDESNSGENALKTESEDDIYVVHFARDRKTGEEQAEILERDDTSFLIRDDQLQEASFEAESFSVYAIIDAPEPSGIKTVQSLEELAEAGEEEGFLLSIKGPKYFSSALNSKNCLVEVSDTASAAIWYFEPVEGQENQYLIYTMDGGSKKYIHQKSGNDIELTAQGTAFTVSVAADGKFYIKHAGQSRWLQHSGSGGGIRFYTDNRNPDNSQIILTYADSIDVPDDPYDLDGKTYGIAYHDNDRSAAALTADSKTSGTQQRLAADKMTVKPDVLDHDGILLVAEGIDITEWTFESVTEDYYYISTTVDGNKKYLTIDGGNVTLADEADPVHSLIKAVPGTGTQKGKYSFSAGGYFLNLQGKNVSEGFNAVSSPQESSWLNLVEKSDTLNDDDFITYRAEKVSVSDTENVYDGKQVIVYTRIWNDDAKRYEYYAVDHNGTLIPCQDNGNRIEWIGSQINTALWTFTEYKDSDDNPLYYYELRNTQYDNYMAPLVSENQTFSDDPIRLNLDGRRYGRNYTKIVAWDDKQYSFSGLKVKDGKVVPCALSEADDFYFAIIDPKEPQEEEPLAEVSTVDNNKYGISIDMFDFNNRKVSDRDSGQTAYMGLNTNGPGLLSTNLGDDGYPVGTSRVGAEGQGHSFADLIAKSDGVTSANHLFLESIYNESGYFEYDSTQNFAHLNDNGDFTVYEEIGAITGNSEHKNTREHGQFMPYNNISEGNYAIDAQGNVITNQTDVLGNPLSDSDPRKGEAMYDLGNSKDVDYFFGMEMNASFTQTANGLDAWGHDIIFEFSGDDDFWFYVDGELVLDLGGVHSAQVGTVNFRTGVITSSNGNSTLYDTFRKNYLSRGMSEAEANSKLAEIFEEKIVDGKTVRVLRDYTNHDMKMLYMERGAGASNLYMRFNLAAVEPGSFILSKKLSGTDDPSNDLIECPYQIYYKTKDGVEHLLGEEEGEADKVVYEDTNRKVRYAESFTPAGGTHAYSSVFFLKPGESAQVMLPEDAATYRVVECGINPNIFDQVSANEAVLTGTPTDNMAGGTHRCDYSVPEATLDRQKVDFDNHVRDGAMRSLEITKKLYDTNGTDLLHYDAAAGENDDKTLFSYRLFLGNESTDAENLPAANLYPYFVKNRQGSYCRWDAANQKFASLEIYNYEDLETYLDGLSEVEKESVIFKTSQNGSISKIPADYTVEVRNLIADAKFKVLERDDEIPRGYALRLDDGYQRIDAGHTENTRTVPITGTIEPKDPDTESEEPHVLVSNQKGWGLTVRKIWTDKDFMEYHGDIFFAVYVKPQHGNHEHLIDDTVRILRTTDSEIYYFFDTLHVGDTRYNFDDFIIREVTLTGDYTVDPDTGKVSGYNSVHPIINQPLHVSGKPIGGQEQDNIMYTVSYETGSSTGHNENVRIDTVTNSRPGIKIYKTEWDWKTPLGGADFTLKDADGHDVIAKTYTSRESDGLVTIAYLEPGTYTLEESGVPKGYVAMDEPVTFTVRQNNRHIEMDENDFCKCTHQAHDHNDMAEITVRNRTVKLQAVKKDSSTGAVISGAHFALYKMVTDAHGNPRKDYSPMEGYEDLETDESGIIPSINMDSLITGTYYLEETSPAPGYEDIDDICFTIGKDGKVTVDSGDHGRITSSTDNNGLLTYTLTVTNGLMKKVSFMKVDISDTDASLSGAEFDLYSITGEGDDVEETLIMSGLVSDDEGMLSLDSETVFALPTGTYKLTETDPPEGYTLKENPVIVTITDETDEESIPFEDTTPTRGVTYDDGTALSAGHTGMSYDNDTAVYTMKVSNTAGYELPSAGGIGTTVFYIIGTILLLGCGIVLAARRRVNSKI